MGLDSEKNFDYWVEQMRDLIGIITREHDHKYLAVYRLTHRLREEHKAQGFYTSYIMAVMALRKFYDTIVLESKNPDTDFSKMPVEWQWDVCAELNDAEIEEALNEGRFVEYEDQMMKKEMGIGG